MAHSLALGSSRLALRPRPRLVGAAAFAALALVATLILTATALGRIGVGAYGATGDFLSFYGAGHLIRTGEGAHLYDAATQETIQRALYPSGFDNAIGYPLPVFAAWIFAPFSALPFRVAFFIWIALNTLLLAVLARAVARLLTDVPTSLRRTFVAVFALSMPAMTAITFGQVDLIVFAGMFGAYLLLRDRRDALAGVALSLALFKPHFLVGFVLLLVITRRWRALGALAAVGVPLIVLPALLTSPHLLVENVAFIANYPTADKHLAVNAAMMSNWRGFVTSATRHNNIWLWLPGLAIIAAAALAISVRCWRRAAVGSASLDQAYALAVMLPLLASPHLHTQSLVLLFIPLALYVRASLATILPPDRRAAIADDLIVQLLYVFATLFACWFAGAIGLEVTVFVIIALFYQMAFRWTQGDPVTGGVVGSSSATSNIQRLTSNIAPAASAGRATNLTASNTGRYDPTRPPTADRRRTPPI